MNWVEWRPESRVYQGDVVEERGCNNHRRMRGTCMCTCVRGEESHLKSEPCPRVRQTSQRIRNASLENAAARSRWRYFNNPDLSSVYQSSGPAGRKYIQRVGRSGYGRNHCGRGGGCGTMGRYLGPVYSSECGQRLFLQRMTRRGIKTTWNRWLEGTRHASALQHHKVPRR